MVQGSTRFLSLEQDGTSKYKNSPIHTRLYKTVPASTRYGRFGTRKYKQGTRSPELVQDSTGWYRAVPEFPNRYRMVCYMTVQAGTGISYIVHTSMYQYVLVRTGTYLFVLVYTGADHRL